jgi:hypothetical protein
MKKLFFPFILVLILTNCGGVYKDESICNRKKALALLVISQDSDRSLDERLPNLLLFSECSNAEKTRSSFSE